jgi:hypothetical protein
MVLAGLVAAGFALVAASSAVSEWVLRRVPDYAPVLRRLPRYEGQSGDPDMGRLNARIEIAAVRRAAELVPDDALYYVDAPEPFAEGLDRVARLFFVPSVAVRRPDDAAWILAFRSRSPPPGVVTLDSFELGRELSLLRIGRH